MAVEATMNRATDPSYVQLVGLASVALRRRIESLPPDAVPQGDHHALYRDRMAAVRRVPPESLAEALMRDLTPLECHGFA
jgi:hypothetical protein